jgi:hypothetical protein
MSRIIWVLVAIVALVVLYLLLSTPADPASYIR